MVVGSNDLMVVFFFLRVGDVGLGDCLFFGELLPKVAIFFPVGELLGRVELLK